MKSLDFCLSVLFYPSDTFPLIKNDRSRFDYFAPLVLLLSVVVVRMAYIYIVHYPLAEVLPTDANIWLETAILLVPLLTWVLASYAVTTIINGEALMRELLAAAAYAMLPYIICMIPLALLSHIMGQTDAGLYSALQGAMWVWIFILFFISVQTLHEYSFWQTVGIIALSIFAMAIIWAVAVLFYILTAQIIQFIDDVLLEIRMLRMR